MPYKYVMTPKGPVIFPDTYSHDDFKHLPNIESAGTFGLFCETEPKVFLGPGGSVSLNKKVAVSDKEDLENFMKGNL